MFFVKPLRSAMMDRPVGERGAGSERRVAVYEAEISRLKRDNCRQRKLLDAVYKPEVRIYESDLQQLLVSEDEVPSVKQKWSPSLNQKEPEPPHIKEEEEELWISQEEEQLQGSEKTDITKLPFPPVLGRSENDEEKARSSQLQQSKTEEKREAQPPASTPAVQMKPEPDGEDCGPSEPASSLDQEGDLQPTSDGNLSSVCFESKTEDSVDGQNKTREPQSGLDTKENSEITDFSEKMNEVDFLLERRFENLSLEDKLEIKRLGAHQPQDVVIIQTIGKNNRRFNVEWFSKKKWLTVSIQKKALFCFPCLLFGGDGTWSRTGYNDLKHLSERIVKHENSGSHMDNAVKLGLLGRVNVAAKINRAHRHSIEQHNRQVEENRYVLSRLITCIKLCGKWERALQAHNKSTDSLNPGIFRCIFETLCENDSRLQKHFDAQPIFKGTSSTVQNELLDCMYDVYREEIAKQVEETSFVAIQVDETTDVSCKPQMVVVLRYMLPDSSVKERFFEFVEVKDKTALGLFNSIKGVLEPLKLGDKLIAQTYYGAALMSEHICGVQMLMKEAYPHAQFVHCYAHQLNLTLQQLCSARVSLLRVFFADLTAFVTFFSDAPKRVAALVEATQRHVPRPPAVQGNFKSRTVNAVWENRAALLQCMEDIRTQPGWDEATISEAYGLSKKLRDRAFLQLLEFFSLLMPEVDVLYDTLQERCIDAPGIRSALTRFKENVQNLRQRTDELAATAHDGADEPGRRVTNTALVMKEACDIFLCQVELRFSRSDHLIAAKLVDSSLFPQFALSFPTYEFKCAVKLWPVGNKEKLKSELTTLYHHKELHTGKTALSLLTSIHENDLEEAFAETVTLLKIIITTPMMTSESERNFSTLKRIKAFTHNTMGQLRLNALAMLSIESQLIQQLHDFIPKVIEKFAQRKNRRAAFLFK